MKIEKEQLPDRQIKITAEFDSESLESYKRRAARKISERTKIPGFRPGKAPFDVVKRLYGEDALEEQAIELLVDDMYPDVLKQAEVEPYGPGSLQEIPSKSPLRFVFLVPLVPEVKLGDYKSIRKEYSLEPVKEKDVEAVINNLRAAYATTQELDRSAETGDLVEVILSATIQNPAEDQPTEYIKEQPAQFIVGENEFGPDDWPFAGFTHNLLGVTKGEEKDIVHKFPKNAHDAAVQGKSVVFHIKTQSIKSFEVPELNNDFAQLAGEYESLDAMKSSVRQRLEDRRKAEYEQEYYSDLVGMIVDQAEITYPPQMLDDETEHVIQHLEEDLAEQHLDLDTYLKMRNTDRARFVEEEARPAARKRIERNLVMEQLAKSEDISLDKEELEKEVTMTFMQLQNDPKFSKVKGQDAIKNLTNAVTLDSASRLINRRVLERIKSIATGQAQESIDETNNTEKVSKKKAIAKSSSGKIAVKKDGVQPTTKEKVKGSTSTKKRSE